MRGTRGLPGVGAQLLVMEPGSRSFDDLVGSIDLGLYVNSFSGMHSGVNPVSGDFSVGADGLMIRNGAIAEPVRELTLASTLQRLLLDVPEVGGDFEWLKSGHGACSLVIGDVSRLGLLTLSRPLTSDDQPQHPVACGADGRRDLVLERTARVTERPSPRSRRHGGRRPRTRRATPHRCPPESG